MNKYISSLFISIFFMFLSPANGQVAEVKISFSKDSVLIGDYLYMHVSAMYKDGDILLPLYKDSFAGFEIIESNPPFVKDTNGFKEKHQELTLIQFNPGQYNFAPAPFIYKNGNKLDTIYSNSFSVFVNTIKLDTTDVIKPLKGPIKIPYTLKEIMPYILGVIGVLLLVLLIVYWLIQRKKKANPIAKILTKEEAHELALKKLKALEAAKRWQSGDVKNYYLILSETIREYIENRFQILAKESTTPEIIENMNLLNVVNKGQIKHLQELLELSDLAKFAKMVPFPEENIKAMKLSYDFVTHTKPQKEVNLNKKSEKK